MLEVAVLTVYTWVKRYEENGIKGLETRPCQGRKHIMDCSFDIFHLILQNFIQPRFFGVYLKING
ncbi:helix-turn-helix domain-containing protein [Prevotella sp.]